MHPEIEKNGFPLFFVQVSDDLGRYDEVAKKVKAISERFPASKYPRVLDICCGLGHFARALADAGYDVTAIDLSEEQIEVARAGGSNANFQIGDMRTPPSGPFDILLNTYSSFGYMPTRADDFAVLQAWRKSVRLGGVLLMELSDIERAKGSFGYPNDKIDRKTSGVRELLSMDWDEGMLFATYVRDGKSLDITTRIYSADELEKLLLDAGFSSIARAGDFSESAKRPSDRLVLTCLA